MGGFVKLTAKRINDLIGAPGSLKRKRADRIMKEIALKQKKEMKAKGFILKNGVFVKKTKKRRKK